MIFRSRATVDLVLYRVFAELRAESQRTYIGFVWWFIDPLVNMMVFYFIFSYVMKRGTDDYIPFLLTGMVVWKWFGSTLPGGANSIRANAGLMSQVYLDKSIFPLTILLVNGAKFVIALGLLTIFLILYGYDVTRYYAALPAILIVHFFATLGPTLILAAVVPFLPDINLLLENVLRILFFLSGIIFPIGQLGGWAKTMLYLNPMVILIESYRDVLMYQRWPSFEGLGVLLVASLALFTVGQVLIRLFDHEYPKVTM